jgi:ADP-L-glycero-D-manno-heptose 6-epimerase
MVHDSHSSFCEEVFSRGVVEGRRSQTAATRRSTNEVERTNILASGLRRLTSRRTPSSRLHPRTFSGIGPKGSRIQLQQRNCSGFTPDFSRRSTVSNSQRTKSAIAACASALKIYLVRRVSTRVSPVPATEAKLNLLVTGGAGFIGSNLVLELQQRFPNSRLTVIDDFRSGDFKNLAGYRGDFVAADLAKLNWREQFGEEKFDAIFHLASITDTTNHNQFEQTHDNVESFRRLLEFARPNRTRVIFASSASVYGATTEASAESTVAAPANIYAFSKAIMDNLATGLARENPDWIIVGARYFNVYGPREAHKGVPASMIYHLSQQMRAGQRPRIFKHGEQRRDFVYVKDVVDGTIRALDASASGIYNLGSGQARSFNELVFILNRSLQTNLQPDYFDNPHAHYQNFTQADLTRAREALGYAPQFPLEAGVADYMKWLYPS